MLFPGKFRSLETISSAAALLTSRGGGAQANFKVWGARSRQFRRHVNLLVWAASASACGLTRYLTPLECLKCFNDGAAALSAVGVAHNAPRWQTSDIEKHQSINLHAERQKSLTRATHPHFRGVAGGESFWARICFAPPWALRARVPPQRICKRLLTPFARKQREVEMETRYGFETCAVLWYDGVLLKFRSSLQIVSLTKAAAIVLTQILLFCLQHTKDQEMYYKVFTETYVEINICASISFTKIFFSWSLCLYLFNCSNSESFPVFDFKFTWAKA